MNNEQKTIQAAVIHTSGYLESIVIESLEDMQKAVGGLIEAYPMQYAMLAEPLAPHTGKFEVYINEEGLLDRLPLNLPASLSMGILVHGDVLVTGPIDDEGETTTLPTEVWHELPRMLREPEFSFRVVGLDEPEEMADGLEGGEA